MRTSTQADRRRCGATLIEVMVAAMILATLAIAGGAVMHRARALQFQEDALRTATDIASSRLEEVRAAPYPQVKPPSQTYDTFYLTGGDGSWSHHGSLQSEGDTYPRTTMVRYRDLGLSATNAYDCVVAMVVVGYPPDEDSTVRMETVLAPR